jgi:hypothetical protein
MCEAREAIHARTAAAKALTNACLSRLPPIASAFAATLAEPIPDDMRRIARAAERRVRK